MTDPWSASRPRAAPVAADRPGWSGGRHHGQRLGLRAALVLLALWMGIAGLGFLPHGGGGWAVAPVPQALAAVFLLICVGVFRWSETAMGLPRYGSRWLLWLPGLYLPVFAVLIALNGAPGVNVLMALSLSMAWLALSEELMFRGLLFPALRGRMGIWPAIWLTTVLFGAAHVANVAGTGNLTAAVVQSIAATSTGLLLLAIRLRRGSIWPAVVYHLLWNVGVIALGMAEGTPGEATWRGPVDNPLWQIALPLLMVLPNGLYGLYLMRHAGRIRLPGDPGRLADDGSARHG